ncbi:hypothetical protein B0H13DRAFT_289358 [Mycena leptocephala]|nr:hypothetical protein B0H13DRAFT_289358 [Mycena leptocephala]
MTLLHFMHRTTGAARRLAKTYRGTTLLRCMEGRMGEAGGRESMSAFTTHLKSQEIRRCLKPLDGRNTGREQEWMWRTTGLSMTSRCVQRTARSLLDWVKSTATTMTRRCGCPGCVIPRRLILYLLLVVAVSVAWCFSGGSMYSARTDAPLHFVGGVRGAGVAGCVPRGERATREGEGGVCARGV